MLLLSEGSLPSGWTLAATVEVPAQPARVGSAVLRTVPGSLPTSKTFPVGASTEGRRDLWTVSFGLTPEPPSRGVGL